jgi:hypothetical protein
MNGKKIRKEAVSVKFESLSGHLFEETYAGNEKPVRTSSLEAGI